MSLSSASTVTSDCTTNNPVARYYNYYYYFFDPRQICFRGSLKIKIYKIGYRSISPCSQGLASCHVTRQRWSAALAPKLFGTEKLLPCHRLRMRRSSFLNYQRVGMLTCSEVPRFQTRRGTDCQCWHTLHYIYYYYYLSLQGYWHQSQEMKEEKTKPVTAICLLQCSAPGVLPMVSHFEYISCLGCQSWQLCRNTTLWRNKTQST